MGEPRPWLLPRRPQRPPKGRKRPPLKPRRRRRPKSHQVLDRSIPRLEVAATSNLRNSSTNPHLAVIRFARLPVVYLQRYKCSFSLFIDSIISQRLFKEFTIKLPLI